MIRARTTQFWLRWIETAATLLLISVLSARAAWAKSVSIAWKPLPGAVRYEIEIQRDGKKVSRKRLEEPGWKGSLSFGVYLYRIRAYDRIQRAGLWSDPLPLVVMPPPPEPATPASGKKVVLYSPDAGAQLRWEPVKGVSLYRVELTPEGKPPEVHEVSDPSLVLKGLAAGEYSWRVTAIVKPKGRLPASITAKQWESEPSEATRFKIERAALEAPVPSSPLGTLAPPSDGWVKFKWSRVEGAESYELEVYPKDEKNAKAAGARQPAAEPKPLAKLAVPDNSTVVKLPGDGRYYWKIRALANIDDKKNASATGPQSTAEFKLDKNASFFDGAGYVSLSMMLAPYSYQVISAAANSNGTAASSAITVRGSGEYWFKPQWGVGAAFEDTSFEVAGNGLSRYGFELVGKYRVNLGVSRYPWSVTPKLGFEERDYIEIFPPGFAVPSEKLVAYGAQLGADVRKQFNERLSLGIKLAYFLPLKASADGVDGLTSDASYRNVSLGAQGLYWLGPHWGLGAGIYLERRSISFSLQGAPAGTQPEQIYMDGVYFFGSLVYRFGK